ncbi:hypothetical protein [Streptomyces sp. NPDC002738]
MTAPVDARDILAEVAGAAVLEPVQHTGYLPEEFWSARPVLGRIRHYAHTRGVSGDALLYAFLARLSGMLPHHVQAVSGLGGRASLNLFVAVVGGSGVGKSTGAKVNREMLPAADPEFRDGLPIGSGEGIAEAFIGIVDEPTGDIYKSGPNKGDPVTKRVRKQVRHNAFFYIDEGQIIGKLSERTGSTLGETLRRAAVGETLGQTNGREETTRYVEGGTYSLGLLVGFQPSTAAPVLEDASTGTPQRFLWCWAADPSIPFEAPTDPGPLDDLKCLHDPGGPVDVTFPDSIRAMLRREHVMRNRGELEVAEHDAHAGLIKVKASALLALVDGRYEVTEADWALAEMLWAASCGVRDTLLIRAQREAAAAKQASEDAKVATALRTSSAVADQDHETRAVAQLVKRHAAKVGGITWGEMNRKLRSDKRMFLERGITFAIAQGWIHDENGRLCVLTD